MKQVYFLVAVLALASSLASAYDPSPLQDFCVAINETDGVFVNGKFCKDPKLVKAEDFFIHVEPGNTANPLGSQVTPVFVDQLPGLNTLGISLARIDFAPKGLNPPHTHPRGTEGLIHFQLNVGYGNAVAISGLSSQNPGTIIIANALFKANPPISPEVLSKAFQVDKKVIDQLQKNSWYDNN
ncbi:germin-like protein subfamily 1 member 7 isoform X4 [Abrus precatorius]|uniref:Germin-like protein subfamily 1 member 7 isoform X4 n=1 Tax=Abrus precatorius TaxID=3816 RepID=A0A8B8L388_ABRPR|nr:germin-like protein subfamily 1 member 7 isoform X4 [Abrus precatorius]XP_027349124.1 germin-like protein subfamily 1 member 7 isoform X4 [Abrus precatorius]XP_027350169.1 germin-like protein subfamily 1 member 7 isoform X4 [Abrus precatorius]XP_027350245.1 germin-like protein subfamily 1 member 7 isoform X4 [Abrus precatorius]